MNDVESTNNHKSINVTEGELKNEWKIWLEK